MIQATSEAQNKNSISSYIFTTQVKHQLLFLYSMVAVLLQLRLEWIDSVMSALETEPQPKCNVLTPKIRKSISGMEI